MIPSTELHATALLVMAALARRSRLDPRPTPGSGGLWARGIRFTPAHYEPELPSERDVEARASDLSHMFGRRPSDVQLREFRETPKRGVVDVRQLTFDGDGLLWVATTRDRSTWSYLDVYADGGETYLGSVRVRDRMLAFDVLDATLAVLVERQDARGLPSNAIDGYDIRGWVDSVTATPPAAGGLPERLSH